MPRAKSAAATPGSLRPSGRSRRTVAALPLPSAPIAAPPRRSQSSSLRSAGLPVPTTISRSRLGACRRKKVEDAHRLALEAGGRRGPRNESLDAEGLGLGAELEVLAGEDDRGAGELPAGLGEGYRDGLVIDCLCRGLGAFHRLRIMAKAAGERHSFQAGAPMASTTPARNRANLRRRRPLRGAAQAS